MLISADLTPLKKLAQDHPTARVIDLCQQLQLTPFVHLVNCRLSTAGTLNRQVAELAEIYLPLPQNIWNSLAAAPESVPYSFNTARPVLMKGIPWRLESPKNKASFTLNPSCKLIHAPPLLFN